MWSRNESPRHDFSVRDRRSPLPTRRMSRIAKGLLGPAVQKQRLRRWPKAAVSAPRERGPARSWIGIGDLQVGPTHTGGPPMHNRIDIDHRHSLAISQEIGERLQASLRVESELPPSIRNRIERLHELEGQSPSIIPTMEHDAGNNDQRPVGTRPSWWRRKYGEHSGSYAARTTERKRGP